MKKTPARPSAAFRMTPQRAELLRALVQNWTDLTGGAQGLFGYQTVLEGRL